MVKRLSLYVSIAIFTFLPFQSVFAFNIGDTVDVLIPVCDTQILSGVYEFTGVQYAGQFDYVFYSVDNSNMVLYYYPDFSGWYIGEAGVSNNWALIPLDNTSPVGDQYGPTGTNLTCDPMFDRAIVSNYIQATSSDFTTQMNYADLNLYLGIIVFLLMFVPLGLVFNFFKVK